MKKLVILLAFCLLIFGNFSAFAQDDEVVKDDLELCFIVGSGFPGGDVKNWNDTLGAKGKYALGIEAGVFLDPNFVLGINFTYNIFSINNETDSRLEGLSHRLYRPSLYLKYNLPSESNWSPFVKVHAGLDFAKFTTFVENPQGNRYRAISYDPGFSYGVGAGIFYYTWDYSGLFLEANYHASSLSDKTVDYGDNTYTFGSNLSMVDVHFGIKVLFGNE